MPIKAYTVSQNIISLWEQYTGLKCNQVNNQEFSWDNCAIPQWSGVYMPYPAQQIYIFTPSIIDDHHLASVLCHEYIHYLQDNDHLFNYEHESIDFKAEWDLYIEYDAEDRGEQLFNKLFRGLIWFPSYHSQPREHYINQFTEHHKKKLKVAQ